MNYFTTVRKHRRDGVLRWVARLIYKDAATGARKEKTKSAASQSKARKAAKKLEDDFLLGGQVAVESDNMVLGTLLEHCLKTRYYPAVYDSEGRKKGGVRGTDTVNSHIKALAGFFGAVKDKKGPEGVYVGGIKIREIKVVSLRSVRRFLLEDRSIPTTNRIMSTFRAILNEALLNDWITVNPFSKVKAGELITIADERQRQTILTAAQEDGLLEACGGDSRRHLRALVVVALDTGARQGELLALRWDDVRFDDAIIKNITSYKGKTVSHRQVPLTKRMRVELEDLKKKKGASAFRASRKTGIKPADDLVFGITSNVQSSWEAAREDAGLDHIRFHDLRHTAATRLVKGNMPEAFVGQILGHSDPKTTRRYVNSSLETINEATTILEEWQAMQRPPSNGDGESEMAEEVIH